jgi:autotransporter translocation and assembly factor TamB
VRTAQWPRTAVRWAAWTAVALAVAAVAFVWLLHTSPARRFVLGRAVQLAARDFGVRIDAADLDYNLLRLRVSLTALRLSALDQPAAPFFEAERLDVDLPRSVLRGQLAFTSIRAQRGRLRVVRSADGSTNLPSSRGGSGDPAPLQIDRLRASDLDIDISDAVADVAVTLTGVDLDVGPAGGSITTRGGLLRRGTVSAPVTEAAGGLGFDGTTIRLDGLRIATGDATVRATGTIDVLGRTPQVRLELSGIADVPGIARWAIDGVVPEGQVAFTGTVAGPRERPTAAIALQSERLTWSGLDATNLTARLELDAARVRVTAADTTLAGGRVALSGDSTFDTGITTADATWQAVDLATLARALASDVRPRPDARTSGSARLRGRGSRVEDWTLAVDAILQGGRTARDQVSVDGTLAMRLDGTQWRLSADGAAGPVPIVASVAGRLNAARWGASSVSGTVSSSDVDVAALVSMLTTVGLLAQQEPTPRGVASVSAQLAGTWASPVFDATARVTDLDAAGLRGLRLEAAGRGTLAELAVEAVIEQGPANAANTLTWRGTVQPSAAHIDGHVDGRLPNLPALGLAPLDGVASLSLDTTGPLETLQLTGQVDVVGTTYDGYLLGDVRATLASDVESVTADARLERFDARVQARLDRTTRAGRIEVAAPRVDLVRLFPGESAPVTGEVALTATAEGPVADWERGRASVEVSRLDAALGTLPIAVTDAIRLDYADGQVHVVRLAAHVGDLQLDVAGRIPLRAAAPDVSAADALYASLVGDVTGLLAAAAWWTSPSGRGPAHCRFWPTSQDRSSGHAPKRISRRVRASCRWGPCRPSARCRCGPRSTASA